MKHQGVRARVGSHKPIVLLVSVARIADQRMSQMPEMKPDLVKAPRFGSAFYQAVSRRFVGTHRVSYFGARQGAVEGACFLRFGVVRCGKWFFDDSLVFRPSPDDGPIHFGRSPVNKLQLQGVQRIAWKGKQHDSACGFVQSMHGLQPGVLVPGFVDKISQVVHLVKVDVCPVHEQSAGFRHGEHGIILVQGDKGGF